MCKHVSCVFEGILTAPTCPLEGHLEKVSSDHLLIQPIRDLLYTLVVGGLPMPTAKSLPSDVFDGRGHALSRSLSEGL